MLILHPTELAFPPQYLEQPHDITFMGDGALGFYRAESDLYNGHRVWKPGIVGYSQLFPAAQLDQAAYSASRDCCLLEARLASEHDGDAHLAEPGGYRDRRHSRTAVFRFGHAARIASYRLVPRATR